METLGAFGIRWPCRANHSSSIPGLSSSGEPDVEQCLRTLGSWADRVRSETERHSYRFRQKPAEFEHSEGFFRMLMLSVVLYEDFSVRYNPDRIGTPGSLDVNDHFFADPRNVFLHGLLGARSGSPSPNPLLEERVAPSALALGTCSSMPVLYMAIGRCLGYPLKLVTTKAHLFVRWEGAGERFNIEATGRGLNRLEDDYYRH